MKQLAIWAWIIVILVLTGAIVPGLVIIGIYTVLLFVLYLFKRDWFDKFLGL
jgi:hypothetical protein